MHLSQTLKVQSFLNGTDFHSLNKQTLNNLGKTINELGLVKGKITIESFVSVVGLNLQDLKDSNSTKEGLFSLIMQAFQEHLVTQLISSKDSHSSKIDSYR